MSVFLDKLSSDAKLEIQKSAEVIVLRIRAKRRHNLNLEVSRIRKD